MFFGLEKRDDVDRLYNRIVEADFTPNKSPQMPFGARDMRLCLTRTATPLDL